MVRASTHIPALILLGGLLLAAGCSEDGAPTKASAQPKPRADLPGVLTPVQWLIDHRNERNLVIVDARSPERFASGHIPGAVNIPTKSLLDPSPVNSKNIAPVTHVQDVFSKAGIDMQQRVIVYDDSNYREAARVFWVLEVHGHARVGVLDGGLGAWTAANHQTSTNAPRIAPRRFVANMQPDKLATKLSVMRAIEDRHTVILDSRSADEYEGRSSKAARSGHIKRAINVDFERNLITQNNGVCNLKYSDELEALYNQRLQGSRKVITYCNSGNRASVSYLALRALGYNAAVYDGSWLEWGNDTELPIE